MKTNYEIRYAAHPEDAKSYDTKRIRRDFLIEKVFSANEVNMVSVPSTEQYGCRWPSFSSFEKVGLNEQYIRRFFRASFALLNSKA